MADPIFSSDAVQSQYEAALRLEQDGNPLPLVMLFRNLVGAMQGDLALETAPHALRGLVKQPACVDPPAWRHILHGSFRWCEDIAVLRDLLGATLSRNDLPAEFATIARGALQRPDFIDKLAEAQLHELPVISLGSQCIAFDLPARFGFSHRIAGLSALNPFSLAVHKPGFLLETIQKGWTDYAAGEQLMVLNSASGLPCIARRDGAAFWNHHIGSHWADNDFARFRQSIATLAANFDHSIVSAAPFPTFIVAFHHPFRPDQDGPLLVQLLEAVRRRCAPRQPRLVAMAIARDRTEPSLDRKSSTLPLIWWS